MNCARWDLCPGGGRSAMGVSTAIARGRRAYCSWQGMLVYSNGRLGQLNWLQLVHIAADIPSMEVAIRTGLP